MAGGKGADAMITIAREGFKHTAGWLLAHSSSKYQFRNGIFILAHMRCGSTALSNILCSRSDICGYGEAHIRYDGRGALGRLALNQRRRGGWKAEAPFLFDKILHSRHDAAAPPDFFAARAIFMLREPEPAIRSICKLFEDLGRNQYRTHSEAAEYYIERVEALGRLWDRFPQDRRIGLTHSGLLHDPDAALAAISAQLGLNPPLENRYTSPEASRLGGGGDPMQSGRHSRIEPALLRPAKPIDQLDIPVGLAAVALQVFTDLRRRFAEKWPLLAI